MKFKMSKLGSNKNASTLLIDGDMIAFACASATDGKYYAVNTGNGELSFKKKKDADIWCHKNGKEEELIEEKFDPEPVEHALHYVREMLSSIIQDNDNAPYFIFLTGRGNYRYSLATILPYKGNRDGVRKPAHLQACRDLLIRDYKALVCEGEEADDRIGIMQIANALSHPDGEGTYTTVICTLDKDLNMIPGPHYCWPMFGKEAKKFYVDEMSAIRIFYTQLITGDTTDNIMGLSEKAPKRRTFSLTPIEKMEKEKEMYDYVFEGYALKYCDDAEKMLKENARLLWIRRKEGEIWETPYEREK